MIFQESDWKKDLLSSFAIDIVGELHSQSDTHAQKLEGKVAAGFVKIKPIDLKRSK